mgnify:CR=1 FL=1
MKINVSAIHEIEPQIEMRKPQTLNITAVIEEYQAEKIFYNILDYFGDDKVEEWFNKEGKKLVDMTDFEKQEVFELPLPEDVEVEAKMVLRSMHIARQNKSTREPGEWTDEELLNGLKLMCASYRKYLLKPAR